MQCRLCLEEKELQNKSHIIPQFMHSQLLSEEGYFHKLKKDTLEKFRSGKLPKEFKTGEYESDILCRHCDNDILNQRYEDYASKVYQLINGELESFKDIEIEEYKNPKDMSGKRIKNIDYSTFKLFLLSILWRASIAKRDFFAEVDLGEKHEEIIRNMLLDGDPKQPDDYPCFIYDMREDQPLLEGWIFQPRFHKVDGNISYEFMISGLAYRFTISEFARQTIALAGVIDKDNSMIIWKAPEGMGKYYYSQFREYYYRIAETE
jgi:hypothetical protein